MAESAPCEERIVCQNAGEPRFGGGGFRLEFLFITLMARQIVQLALKSLCVHTFVYTFHGLRAAAVKPSPYIGSAATETKMEVIKARAEKVQNTTITNVSR